MTASEVKEGCSTKTWLPMFQRDMMLRQRFWCKKKTVGYEVRDRIYKIAKQNIEAQNLQNRIEVIKEDLFDADISNATVIILY